MTASRWLALIGGILLTIGLATAFLSDRYSARVMGKARLGVAVLAPEKGTQEWGEKEQLLSAADFWFHIGLGLTALGIILQTLSGVLPLAADQNLPAPQPRSPRLKVALTPERLDGLKFLSQMHRSIHDQRLKREARVVLTMLAFYVLTTGAIYTERIQLPTYAKLAVLCLFGFLALASGFYLCCSGKANRINMDIAERTENAVIDWLESEGDQILDQRSQNPNRWNWLLEAVIVVVFAVTAGLVVWLK